MKWKKNLYVVHRWLGLLVSVQLLAWSVGGFMFSILDIDDVHGDWDRNLEPPPTLRVESAQLTPAEAVRSVERAGVAQGDVARLSLRTRREGNTVYEFADTVERPVATVNAETGEVVRRITEEEARAAARRDFRPSVDARSVRFLEEEPPLEYRGNRMPVYQVILDHPKEPHIYVCPVTGDVITRRNNPWRIFDFFWMLHIMDYRQRDDFNHWLLTGMAGLAILTSASGLIMWGTRVRWRRLGRSLGRSRVP